METAALVLLYSKVPRCTELHVPMSQWCVCLISIDPPDVSTFEDHTTIVTSEHKRVDTCKIRASRTDMMGN